MHSFHQSRSRIAFEVLCALTVAASCVAAWMQTGASAFLPAAIAIGLYGLWHLTDMRRPKALSPVSRVIEDAPAETVDPAPVLDQAPEPSVKPKKPTRKKAPKAAKVTAEPVATAGLEVEPIFPDRAEIEEELHAPVVPLFEAKPFAQQQRPTFGRKAG